MALVLLGALGVAALPPAALALGPHEILLLANDRSPDSLDLAKRYAALRHVPELNLVRVSIPDDALAADLLSPREFTRLIWNPVTRAVHERGLDGQILAWVYSVDFPVRIEAEPRLSILGLTFLRNRLPKGADVEVGRVASPLFGGSVNTRAEPYQAQTFDALAEWLRDDMPLPAMMLGYTRPPRGNSLEEVWACLERGAAADSRFPSGTVVFAESGDVRSTCRSWQHQGTVRQLARLHVAAVITNAEPRMGGVIGLQIGEAVVHPTRNRYLPGCMAEHLTSAGAIFDTDAQTKATAWIAAGATASSGAIVEPYALWTKFPHADFFTFYASGCTMIESFYQSIRCPLQILLLGEPLAAPWKPADRVHLERVQDAGQPGGLRFRARAESKSGFDYRCFRYYLDGRFVLEGADLVLDGAVLKPGPHALRVVGYRTGSVRQQVFDEQVVNGPSASGGGGAAPDSP